MSKDGDKLATIKLTRANRVELDRYIKTLPFSVSRNALANSAVTLGIKELKVQANPNWKSKS